MPDADTYPVNWLADVRVALSYALDLPLNNLHIIAMKLTVDGVEVDIDHPQHGMGGVLIHYDTFAHLSYGTQYKLH